MSIATGDTKTEITKKNPLALQLKHFEPIRRWDDLPTRINKLHRLAQSAADRAISHARLALFKETMAKHGLEVSDAIEALNDAYCALQDGTLPLREARR